MVRSVMSTLPSKLKSATSNLLRTGISLVISKMYFLRIEYKI
ncbi:hypothetical protein RBH29_14420 [Herbivorax sp. ANBcel31]|nr:hypothetical protein [Herbivorax sp. ANBcel31]MDQ2087624.1 hypothetical protein [Herbivorax sp. ANBcel31]